MYKIIKIFTEPYPLRDDPRRQLLLNILISGFVVIFLAFFQPFGLSQINMPWFYTVPVYIGYGVVTFLVCLIAEKFIMPAFPMFFDEQEWNVGKNIIWLVFIVMLIGLGNLFYSNLLGFTGISGSTLLMFQLWTLTIAIFPITIITLLKRIQYLNKNLKEVKKINQDLSRPLKDPETEVPLVFASENGKEAVTIAPDQFLYAESADNYTDLVYIENGIVRRTLIRSTLKRFEEKNTSSFIIKVHRSYLVNLRKVVNVTSNSQGYRLLFEFVEESVPVAKRCASEVKNLIGKIHGG